VLIQLKKAKKRAITVTQKKSLVAPPKRDLAVPLNAARNLAVFKKKNRAVPQHAAIRKAPKKAPRKAPKKAIKKALHPAAAAAAARHRANTKSLP